MSVERPLEFDGRDTFAEFVVAGGCRTTSAPEHELAILRKVLDSEGVITAVTSSEGVETAKPEPDIVQVALDRAGAEAVFDNPKDLLDHLDVTRIAALAHR